MALRTWRGEQLEKLDAWLRTLNPSKLRVAAYTVLAMLFFVVLPAFPTVLGNLIYPLIISGIVAAVILYRTKK